MNLEEKEGEVQVEKLEKKLTGDDDVIEFFERDAILSVATYEVIFVPCFWPESISNSFFTVLLLFLLLFFLFTWTSSSSQTPRS